MQDGPLRSARDHERVAVPVGRLVVIWGIALAIAATFLVVRSSDRAAREDAALAAGQARAEALASLVADEIEDLYDRLESTAETLLAGPVDRSALDAALPVTGLPVATVMDAETLDVLALNIDVEIEGAQIIAWMPSIVRAVEGERSMGELASIFDGRSLAAFSVPFESTDGRQRVFAVGTLLDDSRFGDLVTSVQDGFRVQLVTTDGRALMDNGVDPRPSEDDVEVRASVADANWAVHVSAPYAAVDPDLGTIWHHGGFLAIVTLLLAAVLAWWVTKAYSDAATIEAAYGRLAWAARQQREFSALVSHELRTPATSASGLATFLAGQWDRLDPDRRRDLAERVARSTNGLAQLVQDLGLSSRLTDGVLPLEPQRHVAGDLVRAAIDVADVPASRITVDGDLEAEVEVDARYATRAVAGLLRNAVIHGGDGDVVVTIGQEGKGLAIVVRDHGPGVPADFRDHLFEPFTQAQSHMRRTHGGTGLGLHLVAAIVDQLGGTITHHDADPGAAFVVVLPRRGQRRSTNTEPASATRAAT